MRVHDYRNLIDDLAEATANARAAHCPWNRFSVAQDVARLCRDLAGSVCSSPNALGDGILAKRVLFDARTFLRESGLGRMLGGRPLAFVGD